MSRPEPTARPARRSEAATELRYTLPDKIRRVGKREAGAAFIRACGLARIEPTRRQWSKWCRSRGLARQYQDAGR